MAKARVIILMGSASDLPHAEKVRAKLTEFGLEAEMHILSAHKTPRELLAVLDELEADPSPKVYITIAGRSNALSGMVDAQVRAPVIAVPPLSQAFGGADIFSSLRMPSGVAPAVVLEPEAAALLAAKMLSLASPALGDRVSAEQQKAREKVLKANRALREGP